MTLSRRAKFASVHLLLSATVILVGAAVIFLLWFPTPYGSLSGGLKLFALLMTVDLTIGPLLTLVIANPRKPKRELRRDLSVIGAIQLVAFAYGVYALSLARPVVVAFEIDRLRVVSAAEVDPETLSDASPGLRELSWTGPIRIAAVKPVNAVAQLRSIDLALSGVDLSMDAKNWRPYADHAAEAWRVAKPLASLVARGIVSGADAANIATRGGRSVNDLRYLPLQSKDGVWIAVVEAPQANIVGYFNADGFL